MPDFAACDITATPQLDKTWVWGVPFARVTFAEAVAQIDRLISVGKPNFVVTANLHYAMLCAGDARLQSYSKRAAMILADGMPIVWASRWRDKPLPERVTGSDLVPLLCELAVQRDYSIYLLGAAPGVADDAKRKLLQHYPSLRIEGVLSPPFRAPTPSEEQGMIESIRVAKPDLLLVAFGQPKGEYWVDEYYERLGVPVVMQIGATLDFIAGRVHRSPRWMQRIGCEWLYRLTTDPRRLGSRYTKNIAFAIKMLLRDVTTRRKNRQ